MFAHNEFEAYLDSNRSAFFFVHYLFISGFVVPSSDAPTIKLMHFL